jgi:hypothetical protein
MRSSRQSGVALVVTVIMLSVVTLMAVAFLAVSRSQKAAVTVVQDQSDARLMAGTALQRAQAEVVGRMLATTNKFAYGVSVSTNYYSPAGFRSGVLHPTNVNYAYASGTVLSDQDRRLNAANLFYFPRPPVYLVTNDAVAAPLDFRFYVDFNRNQRYEATGLLPVLGVNGQPLLGPGNQPRLDYYVGDPEWIGVLERPDRTHSPTNRFLGRYAYLVVPEGRSLDINFIHNRAKFDDTFNQIPADFSREGFLRNQGFGSWELNLAAFLMDLNTNYWRAPYLYATNRAQPNTGVAFADAHAFLAHRYLNNSANLRTIGNTIPDALSMFRLSTIDPFPSLVLTDPYTGPVLTLSGNERWSGSDNPRAYFEAQEFFNPLKSSIFFTNRLRTAMTNLDSYNRYTFYRLLGQMGSDSAPANRTRMNLNFNNLTEHPTNFVPWTPLGFFTNASIRMLQQRFNVALDNIQLYPTNNYTPEVHRMLQVAANVYDATTNRSLTAYPHVPSVFRPRLNRQGNVVSIVGYEEVLDDRMPTTWIDLRLPADRARLQEGVNDVNAYGLPWVVGAKKGWPNFNEFSLQTVVQATRKVELGKLDPRRPYDPANFYTNQTYLLSISNRLGLEFFNSYSRDFPRPLELRVQVQTWAVISNRTGLLFATNLPPAFLTTNVVLANFPGGSFVVPLYREIELLPDSAFYARSVNGRHFLPVRLNPKPDTTPGFPVPDWNLYITNRVRCFVYDRSLTPPRLVDFVNLDGLVSGFNIADKLAETGRVIGDTAGGGASGVQFWSTNRLGGLGAPTDGLTNQVYVSLYNVLSDDEWQNHSADPRAGQDKLKAIDDFRVFMGLPPLDPESRLQPTLERVKQVPFTPTKKFYQEMKWQANDPLVHYTVGDLTDQGALTNPDNLIVLRPPQLSPTNSNLGLLNERYSPWGGRTNTQPQPRIDFNLALKDPLVRGSDDWNFPTNRLANIGLLGRVHRGSPWQTLYLKAEVAPLDMWRRWTGVLDTHPTNDWNLVDLFTIAPTENAARGLLSVSQTNIAAWSAVLSGVPVLSNSIASGTTLSRFSRPTYEPVFIQPNSPQLQFIVEGIRQTQTRHPHGVFPTLGSLLSTRALTVDSPFLRTNLDQRQYAISDDAYERIPQQVLSLLKADEPRISVYAFGQSLKPAANSLVVTPGPFFGLCTNYQITGESVIKAVVRFDDAPARPRAVIESYHLLPAE